MAEEFGLVDEEVSTDFATLVFAVVVVVCVPLDGAGSTMVTARPPFALEGDVWALVAVDFAGVAMGEGGAGNKEEDSALMSATAAAIAGGKGGTFCSTISSSGGSCSGTGVCKDLRPETVRGNEEEGTPAAVEDDEDVVFFVVLPFVAIVFLCGVLLRLVAVFLCGVLLRLTDGAGLALRDVVVTVFFTLLLLLRP